MLTPKNVTELNSKNMGCIWVAEKTFQPKKHYLLVINDNNIECNLIKYFKTDIETKIFDLVLGGGGGDQLQFVRILIQILPSTSKKNKKDLDFNSFVTS